MTKKIGSLCPVPGYNGPLGGTQQIYWNFADFVASDLYLFNFTNKDKYSFRSKAKFMF